MLLTLVIAYLLVTIAIGLWAARRVKSSADYAIAGRHLPLVMIVTTTFATWFGSETVLGIPAKFVEGGLNGVVEDPFGAGTCLILVGLFFAGRLYRMTLLTISDYYRERYGRTVEVVCSLIIILAMATAMTNYIIQQGIPQQILDWFIKALNVSPQHPELEKWKFILALNVFLFIVGMLMDGFSTILVGLPLLLPLAAAFHIHPFHLAVMFLLNMELAYIMPPAGLNLFISSFRFNQPVAKVYRVVIPYVILLHIGLIALIVFPKLSTFSVEKVIEKKRQDAASAKGGERPPTEAWALECIQMDRAHPHPCSTEDVAKWGEDGTGIKEVAAAESETAPKRSA